MIYSINGILASSWTYSSEYPEILQITITTITIKRVFIIDLYNCYIVIRFLYFDISMKSFLKNFLYMYEKDMISSINGILPNSAAYSDELIMYAKINKLHNILMQSQSWYGVIYVKQLLHIYKQSSNV